MVKTYFSLITIIWFALLSIVPQCDAQLRALVQPTYECATGSCNPPCPEGE
ncbi:hypothetical protein Pmar_PMAR000574, partial [Perkinsus marinus ATCC 50983]